MEASQEILRLSMTFVRFSVRIFNVKDKVRSEVDDRSTHN